MSGNSGKMETELIQAETLKTRMKALRGSKEETKRGEVIKNGHHLEKMGTAHAGGKAAWLLLQDEPNADLHSVAGNGEGQREMIQL